MSEDESVEAGRQTGQAFKALLSAALVIADAHRQRQVREMRRMEDTARDRERDAERRGEADTTLEKVAPDRPTPETAPGETAATEPGTAPGVEDPVTLAERWAAAQQPGADPVERVQLDKQVLAAGVDPDQVRDEHITNPAGVPVSEAGNASAEPAGRAADTVHQQGVWQQGSPEVAKAGLSYTRTPGRTITPGLTPQRRPKTPGKSAAKTRDLGR